MRFGRFSHRRRARFNSRRQPPLQDRHRHQNQARRRKKKERRSPHRSRNQNQRLPPVRLGRRRQRNWFWPKLRQNLRRSRRLKRKRTNRLKVQARRLKSRKLFRQKKSRWRQRNQPRLKLAAGKARRPEPAAVVRVEARARDSSAGTAACCTTGFTANGSNRRPLPALEAKIPRW